MISYLKRLFSDYKMRVLLLTLSSIIFFVSLLSYNSSDPSFNFVTAKHPANLLGYFGSYLANFLYQFFGIASLLIPITCFCWALIIVKNRDLFLWPVKIILVLTSICIFSILGAKLSQLPLPFIVKQYLELANNGGAAGSILRTLIDSQLIMIKQFAFLFYPTLVILNLFIYFLSLGVSINQLIFCLIRSALWCIKQIQNLGRNLSILILKLFSSLIKLIHSSQKYDWEKAVAISEDITQKVSVIVDKKINNQIYNKLGQNKKLLDQKNDPHAFVLPELDLLKKADGQNIKMESKLELKQHAEDLLSVLGDFGVKGQMLEVNQGPVVTLYEFEPAAGTKSSRVIGLSDDVARSLSAVSARIAVVPGRNVLGIELPNKQRAFFCLRELLETSDYLNPSILLPLVLGKDLSGKPCIVDLSKMPHLLVAGTTGSGKSVAINAMILSLLYRYSPNECRFIMIDPKMLELSAYDNIPHLLTPVVTEPKKAVVALKWAVKEMENRYRLMSSLGVRNITGYNAKISEAIKNGKSLQRTVQTGFDEDSGKPVYESIEMNMTKLPFIVLVVDEMADLMLVAGKDIEALIQRLAQMARAAGIHIIMATQRPSVDVITGVIKANFPSRISFKVISKIDSRTILGEQGAEQLLGMGDMLYMGNSSKITRVHGPFVDDAEVEKVTQHLRSLGTPEYVPAIFDTVDSDDEMPQEKGDYVDDSNIYNKALQIVKSERKVSISYIQRCLRIGYNRAADIVERMEREGVVSTPSHSGKREVLIVKE